MLTITQLGKFYLPHHGGIENYLHQICKAIKEEVALKVIVSNEHARTEDAIVDGVHVKRLATYGMIASTPITPGFFREVLAINEGIVHLHHPNPLPTICYLSKRGSNVKTAVTYHSDVVNQRILKHAFAPYVHRLLRRSSAIIVSTTRLIDSSEVLSRYRDKCRVIPYPIDSTAFRAAINCVKVAALRARAKRPIVLSIGRLVPYKGFAYLISAMEGVDAELWIIGDGPLRQHLKHQASALNGKVHFLGSVPDVQNYYAAADLFVLSSINRSEAYAIVQMEAMAAGRPVINTALDSGVPYVSRSGESGLTVPPADSKALREAINTLLADPEMRHQMGKNGMRRVSSEFDISKIKQQTLELYRDIAH